VKHWHFATAVPGEPPHAFTAMHGVSDRPPQTLSLRHSSITPKRATRSLAASVDQTEARKAEIAYSLPGGMERR
jgi:hypothetical protein